LELETHVSWEAYANDLRRRGGVVVEETLERTADDSEYPASLDLIFSDLFGALRAPEKRCLELAALLPPDQVPRAWLGAMLSREPQLELKAGPGEEDPTVGVLGRLQRLQLLRVSDEEGRMLRLHRLLGYWLRRSPSLREGLLGRVIVFARERAVASGDALTNRNVRWELGPLAALCSLLLDWHKPDAAVSIAAWVSKPLVALGRYPEARALLEANLGATPGDGSDDALTVRANFQDCSLHRATCQQRAASTKRC
jgi:hypothetical protein